MDLKNNLYAKLYLQWKNPKSNKVAMVIFRVSKNYHGPPGQRSPDWSGKTWSGLGLFCFDGMEDFTKWAVQGPMPPHHGELQFPR